MMDIVPNARFMVLMFCMYDNVDCYQYEVS